MRLTTPEISWHGKEPLFSLDFALNNKSTRLATSGADSNIRMWVVVDDEDNGSKVDFIANLSRHTKAVNVVRFSPQANMLASGGDDCYVIIWKLNEDGSFSQPNTSIDGGDYENKESWQVAKMLRGHIEDVYDLAWSPNATKLISGSVDNSVIIWDTNKGDKLKILKDHRQYVQGVCWDPCGNFVASYSCDRTCRIYNTSTYRCCYNINKATLPNTYKNEQGTHNSKQIKIFHDETMPSFFRRLTFSPDGLLLLVPGGKFEENEKAINTTFVFTKAAMNKPVMYFPAMKKPTIAVKCCPVLFELRNTDKHMNAENKKSVFKLSYRMVMAVASLDSVVLYDTQRTLPFGFLSNIHYASLTDIAWSNDGKILAISSRDGYCSLVTFDDNELGIPYNQTASEVIENKTLQKEVSPCRKPVGRPRSKTPESSKDERMSPKMEKLSIKNFVTVNTPKSSSSPPATVAPITTSTSIANFTTILPAKKSLVLSEETANHIQNSNMNDPGKTQTVVTATTEGNQDENKPLTKQSRRVGFVTLKPTHSTDTDGNLDNTTSNDVQNVNSTTSKVSPIDIKKSDPLKQPRRVGFVTLKPPQAPTISQRNSPSNPPPTANPLANEEDKGKTVTPQPPTPRRVNFVTLKPSETSCTPSVKPTEVNHNGPEKHSSQSSSTSEKIIGQISGTLGLNSSNTNENETSGSTLAKLQTRQERPPVPLEPQVIIIND